MDFAKTTFRTIPAQIRALEATRETSLILAAPLMRSSRSIFIINFPELDVSSKRQDTTTVDSKAQQEIFCEL
jgi:hypothetical protein